MANVVPLVVSGQIMTNQTCILMSIVNVTPYYLVVDTNGVPFFQPIFQDPSNGLPVFQNFSVKLLVAIGQRSADGTLSIQITNISPSGPNPGKFLVNPTINAIVAPGDPNGSTSAIPIEPLSYADNTLMACGYQYVLSSAQFYLSNTWVANPNSQNVGSLATAMSNNFFIFPVDQLIDANGNPASISVYQAIYNDILGQTVPTYLFTSSDSYDIGNGLPFEFCADSSCGPNCFGQCSGKYLDCNRMTDKTFTCSQDVSIACKFMVVMPFLVITALCIAIFVALYFVNKHRNATPATQVVRNGKVTTVRPIGAATHTTSKELKIGMIALVAVPAITIAVSSLMLGLDKNASEAYVNAMCNVV